MRTVLCGLFLLACALCASADLFPLTNRPARVVLAWDVSTDPTVTGYNIYYGVRSRGYTNIVNAGSATTCTVSNLVASTIYYFAATAYNAAGLESDFSAEVPYRIPDQPRPTNPPVSLHITTNLISGLTLPFLNLAMERSPDLGAWSEIGSVFSGSDGTFLFYDLNPPQWKAFYRTKDP